MSQHDQNIANQGYAALRADLNNALGALFSNSSGSTAPSVTVAGQFWLDTSGSPWVLKQRDSSNASWLTLWEVGTANQIALLTALMLLKNADPKLQVQRTGGASNEKLWQLATSGSATAGTGRLSLATLTDAGAAGAAILDIARNGTAVSGVLLSSPLYTQLGIFQAANTGNAFTGTLTPAVTSLTDGLMVVMRASATITGPATLNLNGIGAVAIRKLGSAALISGDIVSGQLVALSYDLTNGWWQMVSPVAAAATFSVTAQTVKASVVGADEFAIADSAASFANAKTTITALMAGITGRLIGAQFFSSGGTYTPTSGTNRILVVCAGGGGGAGGGTQQYNSQSVSSGSNGGTSSFGAFCSANGGDGGAFAYNTTRYAGAHGGATGGSINLTGAGAAGGNPAANGTMVSGQGGNGGLAIEYITSGITATTVTVGGGGAAGSHPNLGSFGRAGASGWVYVLEYA